MPLIVLAGKDYGMGSSRDWAAKGVYLLGVKAVIAESFERIHRSNLVGMGVLPLQFQQGPEPREPGPDRHRHLRDPGRRRSEADAGGEGARDEQRRTAPIEFTAICRIDTPVEIEYYRNGGILHTVLRNMLKARVKQR